MAIDIITGFDLAEDAPIRRYMQVADEAARLAIKWMYKGMLVYQEDADTYYKCKVATRTQGSSPWTVIGDWEVAFLGSTSQLSDLSDVSSAATTTGFVLVADGSSYEGRALLEADISDLGTYLTAAGNETISGAWTFNDVILAAAVPTLGDHLVNKTYVDGLATTPGGATGDIQYKLAGGGFGGEAAFNYDEALNALTLGSRAGANGAISAVFGTNLEASGLGTISSGLDNAILGDYAGGFGRDVNVAGDYAFGFGRYIDATSIASFAGGHGFDATKPVKAGGLYSFNYSQNTTAQSAGHGALADNSVILGGIDNNIEATNNGAILLGGNAIKLAGSTYIDHTVVNKLAIFTAPSSGTTEDVLVIDPVTGVVKAVTQSSFTGEVNTSSNLGGGFGIASSKSGVDLPFKSLIQGTGITITSDANEITITASAAATHNLLSTTHGDTTPSVVSRGSLIVGKQASAVWEELTLGANGYILTSDGTDVAWSANTGTPSPLTTKGDVYTYSTVNDRLSVGTDGYVLTADAAEATGLKWAAIPGGGDMLLGTAQVVTASKTFNDGTLLLDDTDSTFNLILSSTSTITTANKKLTFDVNDADRTLTFSGDATISGTNTGDQVSIVGISGTKTEFDTAVTGGNFMYVGDAPTAHTHPWGDITATPTTLAGYGITDADNYVSWNLKTDGVQRIAVVSGGDLDIVGGTGISSTYSAGGVVTLNYSGPAVPTQLSDLSDVTSATQTAGFAIMSSGGNYAGRAIVEADISDFGAGTEYWKTEGTSTLTGAVIIAGDGTQDVTIGGSSARLNKFEVYTDNTWIIDSNNASGAGSIRSDSFGLYLTHVDKLQFSAPYLTLVSISDTFTALQVERGHTSTNTVEEVFRLRRSVQGGSGADGIGAQLAFEVEGTTGGNYNAGGMIVSWGNAISASRTSIVELYGVDITTEKTFLSYNASTDVLTLTDTSGSHALSTLVNTDSGGTVGGIGTDNQLAIWQGSGNIDALAAGTNTHVLTMVLGEPAWQAVSGGGDVATDIIWDAKGDLAVGTGADTAVKLTAGANGLFLTTANAEATGLKWGAIDFNVQRTESGATYTTLSTDKNTTVVLTNAGVVAITLDASTLSAGYQISILNNTGSTATISRGTDTTIQYGTGAIADLLDGEYFYAEVTSATEWSVISPSAGGVTSIVGITGTKAEYDVSLTDGNFMYIGDTPTSHTHLLVAGATDVTATFGELNLLDLSGLTVGWVLSADTATTASWKAPTGGGSGDMLLGTIQTVIAAKTFNDTTLLLRNVADTFNGSFVNTNTADRIYTLPDLAGEVILDTNINNQRTESGTTYSTLTSDRNNTVILTAGSAVAITLDSTGKSIGYQISILNNTSSDATISKGTDTTIQAGAITDLLPGEYFYAELTDTTEWSVVIGSGVSTIVGITGTKAEYDTSLTDGDFMYIGDTPTSHTHSLAAGATDVTATFGELNLLDLSGLTAGWVLSADTATTASWKAPTGGGDVTKVGTPANNQIGVWTGDGTIEGTSNFTYDGSLVSVDESLSALDISTKSIIVLNLTASPAFVSLRSTAASQDSYYELFSDLGDAFSRYRTGASSQSWALGFDSTNSNAFSLRWTADGTVTSSVGTEYMNVSTAGLFTFGSNVGGGGATNFLRADGTWAAPSGAYIKSDGDTTLTSDINITGSIYSVAFGDALTSINGFGVIAETYNQQKIINAGTTNISEAVVFGRQSTGTPATGFGATFNLSLENTASGGPNAYQVEAKWATATAASEETEIVWRSFKDNAAVDMMKYVTVTNALSLVEVASGRLGIFGVTPVIRQTTTSQTAATFAANTSGISDDTATWNGYTIGDLVAILQAYGLLT